MGYYADLREYLQALDDAGRLRRIARPIDKDTELHPLVRWQFRGLPKDQRTGWLFDAPTGRDRGAYAARVATSIIGPNRDVYGLALQCGARDILDRWQEAYRTPIPPRLTQDAPCKEEVHVGASLLEHGGLNEFPIPFATNGWESLPRLTAVSWHSRDPDSGLINVGTYNALQMGPARTNIRFGHSAGLRVHWRKCQKRGVPLQVAAVIGAVPAVSLASVARVPALTSEHDIIGGLMREPLPVVRCETVDLVVPATAEIVIEGEIPTDSWEMDGASGEHTGYTILNRWVASFHVKAITHRRNPIWHDYVSQFPPSESSTLRGIACEGTMMAFLRQSCGLTAVRDVTFHDFSGAYRFCVIRIGDTAGSRTPAATIWRALQASLSIHTDWPKICVAVDEDIDPDDIESVMWAICFRWQPHRDSRIVVGRTASLDWSAYPPGVKLDQPGWLPNPHGPEGASAILIDATRKWAYPPVALPKRPYMERAREIWESLDLPPLKPREPWFGYELGSWPDFFRRQSELAAAGDLDGVARELTGLRGVDRPDGSIERIDRPADDQPAGG